MSYLQDRKIKKEKYFKIAAATLLLLILFYFRAGVFRSVSFAGAVVFRPVLTLGSSAGGWFGNLGAYFSSKKSLSEENESLRQDLLARDAVRANYDVLARENESLKKILWRLPEDNQKPILAAILLKPNRSPYDTLLIDQGEVAGVAAGDMVYAYGNIPIGRIASVTPYTSKVVLFSSSGETTEVAVPSLRKDAEEGGIFWEATGRGGGNFEMILPRDFILEKGDAVVLPGLNPLTIAVAETVLSDPRSPWKSALLRSPVNIQEIKFVQVETR
ncbi:MAG: rod shape-determining protein MreC [bacterium]|nr:rod shape-determining protein MreC [bacterium]